MPSDPASLPAGTQVGPYGIRRRIGVGGMGVVYAAVDATGAEFSLITMENSLFGPTTTTAGLLVGADIRKALADRHDLNLALIPAECINDDGLFLDEESFVAVRESLPMPVYPSYDFIDALVPEGDAAFQPAA